MIEQRKAVAKDLTVPDEDIKRLPWFLKLLANSASYGILAEFIRKDGEDPHTVTVYSDSDPFVCNADTPEDPGPFCFPPIAACITGAARLMLALLEHAVTDLGGSYAFCDTDSMAIVATRAGELLTCPGGAHQRRNGDPAIRAITWDQVDAIVERFALLNPYNPEHVPGSILEIEDENYDDSHQRHQLWCWALSAKRYALYTRTSHGPVFEKPPSEHGLGHLLNPADPDDADDQDDKEGKKWIAEAWRWMMARDGHAPACEPPWLDRAALSRLGVSSPAVWRWFKDMNRGRPYGDQVKPSNFFIAAHPDPLDGTEVAPVAPYERRPDRWETLDWIDRKTGLPAAITTNPIDGIQRADVRVQTLLDVLLRYIAHPEAKSLAPNGTPVTSTTIGLLARRPVEAVRPARYVGKEANRIDEREHGLLDNVSDYRTEYTNLGADDWTQLVVPVLTRIPRTRVVEASGLNLRSIQRVLAGKTRPHRRNQEHLTTVAIAYAREQLTAHGHGVPADGIAVLHTYLTRVP